MARSMTGFAQAAGGLGGVRWHWEVRSVNGRGLDVRVRVPTGFEALELKVREAVARRIARGNLAVSLTVQRESGSNEVRLNEGVLKGVMLALSRVQECGTFDRPRPESVLAIKGVLEFAEATEDEATVAAQTRAMLGDFDAVLLKLVDARAGEGGRLAAIVQGHLDEVEAIIGRIAVLPCRTPAQIRIRLEEQLKRLLEAAPTLDPTRLHQEAAVLATRADIEEELGRLKAHVVAARELLATSEPVGRKLDFLSQEFNREANTLCSKSNDLEITKAGLDLKAIIDQMREQVQNIE